MRKETTEDKKTIGIKLNFQNSNFSQHITGKESVVGTKLRFDSTKVKSLCNNEIIFVDTEVFRYYRGVLKEIIPFADLDFQSKSESCPRYYDGADMNNLLIVEDLQIVQENDIGWVSKSLRWCDFVRSRANRIYIRRGELC